MDLGIADIFLTNRELLKNSRQIHDIFTKFPKFPTIPDIPDRVDTLFYKFCTNLSKAELEILGNSSTIFRSSHRRCSIKKLFLKISRYSQDDTCVGISFLIKSHACNFIKKGSQHRYIFCEYREIYKNTYFEEHLQTAASAFLESVL